MKRIKREALVRSVDFDKRSVTLVASTDQLCPDNMIILSRAWARDYEAWLKSNPVVLGFHDYHSWAVGHVSEGVIEDGRLVETINFDDVNPEAIVAWSLYSKGHQRAASVGWDTLEDDPNLPIGEVLARYQDDLSNDTVKQLTSVGKANPDRKVTVVTRAKKFETSLVPVGMDDQAVTTHDLFGSRRDDISVLVRAAEEFGVRFVDSHSERPGWEDTNPDDSKDGQIRYRIKDPKLFIEDSIKTKPLDVKGKGDVQLVLGKLKKPPEGQEGSMVNQSVHFNKKDGWTMKAAQDWWKEHEEKSHKGFKLKIVSDGTSYGTYITNRETGELLEDVEAVDWCIDAKDGIDLARANLRMCNVPIELITESERIGKVLSAKNKAAIEETVSAMQRAVALLKNVLTLAEKETEQKGETPEELVARAERVMADVELRRKIRAIYIGA